MIVAPLDRRRSPVNVRTSSWRPSVVIVTAPSRSVRKMSAPALP